MGTGSLGGIIGEELSKNLTSHYELTGVYGRTYDNTKRVANLLGCKAYKSLDQIIEDRPNYVVEAAGIGALKAIGKKVLENGIDLIILSTGALADEDFFQSILEVADSQSSRIHIPSGAVGGLDLLRSAMLMNNNPNVRIITEKPPSALTGAFSPEKKLQLDEKETIIFDGDAKQAIKKYPNNVNVAITTALATVGVEKMRVTIKSVPGLKKNKHRIQFCGDNTDIKIEIGSIPSSQNPKSSALAAWSVVSYLRNMVSTVTF